MPCFTVIVYMRSLLSTSLGGDVFYDTHFHALCWRCCAAHDLCIEAPHIYVSSGMGSCASPTAGQPLAFIDRHLLPAGMYNQPFYGSVLKREVLR